MIKKKRGRYEEIHFLACLNRINVLRGRKMEKLKAKRGLKAVEIKKYWRLYALQFYNN